MATKFFGRLSSKTLTLITASIYSRSLSTTSFLCRLHPLSGAVILPPSFRSLSSTRATIPSLIEQVSHNTTALKLRRNGCNYRRCLVIMRSRYHDRFIGLFRGEPTKEEIMDSYVKTLAGLVG
ncbi:hypothetical protein L195_g043576, partial [Trifolium pratense]